VNFISIEGGYYEPKKILGLFNSNNQIASIVYGKNGSGKSSIARAFLQSRLEEQDDIDSREFKTIEFFGLKQHPEQGMDTNAYAKTSMPCYIHNENFTNQKVAINHKGLESIVMFGDQIEITDDLKILDRNYKNLDLKSSAMISEKETLEDKKNPDSHFCVAEEIKKKLRGSWALRDQKLSQNKISGRVDDTLLNAIFNTKLSDKPLQELSKQFEIKLATYLNIRATQTKNINEIKEIEVPHNLELLIKELARELPSPPELTDKEKQILNIIQSTSNFQISSSINLLESNSEICPTCLNTLEDSHKQSTLKMINQILNSKEANSLVKKINQLNVTTFSTNLNFQNEQTEIVEKETLNAFFESFDHLNHLILELQDQKNKKIANPYVAIIIDYNEYLKTIIKINELIKVINTRIKDFNHQIQQESQLLNTLKKLNREIARKEFDYLIENYNRFQQIYKKLNLSIQSNQDELNNINKERELKLSQLKNVNIALKLINSYLSYIFYDDNRLYLEHHDTYYKIMSRGRPVKPSSLSLGEKNIISLCYFFSTLFDNEKISDLFSKKCILILDDPLSSFDFENKVGVYSFLRYILGELHNGNSKSKSLILTHDLDVLYNLSKVYDDIGIKENSKLKLFNLHEKELIDIKTKNFDEYSLLLQVIYEFAVSPSTNLSELNIGNNMRRILEAFSTFNYKCGIDGISKNEEILNKLDSSQRDYFKNSMYRLILNSESHLQERSKQVLNTSFKEHFSLDEKNRTAKDVLMFLYLLDPIHLKIHLKKDSSDTTLMCAKIESWIEETFKNKSTLESV